MYEGLIDKDPSSILDYSFNWAGDDDHASWLEEGETITSHDVAVGAGLTKDSDESDAGIVTIWLSGGTAGIKYVVACEITTSAGRTEERSVLINCLDR